MRRVLPLKIALASLLIAACVTINVYFPAAAADKAADQVINDITGGGREGRHHHSAAVATSCRRARPMQPNFLVAAVGNALYALVPAAHAQDAEAALNVSSPAVTRIKQSMAARFGELEKFFASGAIGLTKDGMVDVRDLNAVGPARSRHGQAPGRRGQRRPRAALRRDRQGQQSPRVGSRHQEELREALGRDRRQARLVLPGRRRRLEAEVI